MSGKESKVEFIPESGLYDRLELTCKCGRKYIIGLGEKNFGEVEEASEDE